MAADEKSAVPEHLVVDREGRGFAHMPPIAGKHGDDSVRVFESSSAEEPRVWIQTSSDLVVVEGETIISLSAEDAWRLGEQLMTLVAGHYQGDARPAARDRVGDLLDTAAPTGA